MGQAQYEVDVSLNPRDWSDEPTVIGTDPKIKFAKLREKIRQEKALKRYIAILNKHGEDSEQDRKFILKLVLRGDGDVLGLCNVAKAARAVARGEDKKKCPYPHDPSQVCVICQPRPKKRKKRAKRDKHDHKTNAEFMACADCRTRP